MAPSSHANKDVDDALKYAASKGWRIKKGGSHCWGQMSCPYNGRCGEFCITSIWSTPKNPGNHGKAIRRVVDNCTTHREPASKGKTDATEKQ